MCAESILVIVPTRGRRKQCERLLESFHATRVLAKTDIAFIADPDDQETYQDFDYEDAFYGVQDPRGTLSEKLNRAAQMYARYYDALFFVGDDHVFVTDGWDEEMLRVLNEDLGGRGLVYPDDKRRSDVPEIWLLSSDVIMLLGYFAEPTLKHYYLDNAWAELMKRAGMIRFCPQVVIEHRHYQVTPETERDATYSETEDNFGARDIAAFDEWRQLGLPLEVARLRRAFSTDIKWITGMV